MSNETGREVTVLGYVDEPYLRIGPDGVFENLHSAATYLNRGRKGGTVPPDVDTSPAAAPEWRKVSDAHTARFHDHRIHWMNDDPPRPVAEAPGRFHELVREEITVVDGETRITINVALDWVPAPSGRPWIPLAVVLAALGFVIAWRGRPGLVAAALAVLVATDALHAVTYEVARPGGNFDKTMHFLTGGFVSIIVWLAAIATIAAVLRRRPESVYGVAFVAVMVALVGGATDLSALWKSQLPNAGPNWLTRLEVVVSLALGAGVVVGAVLRIVLSGRANRTHDDGRRRWLSLLVVGLDDAELERITRELDAGDVMETALRDLAARLQPVADQFTIGSLAWAVDGSEWTIARDDTGALACRNGRDPSVVATITTTFARALQLLAGVITVADDRVVVDGAVELVERIEPYLSERATPVSDRAPAS
jgi:hypothetical protein